MESTGEPIRDFLTPILQFIQTHPVLIFALIFFVYNKIKSSQPWPDYGGRITTIHSLAEWEQLLAASSNKAVIIDAYATWCPPCKAAAPVYAKLSEELSADSCTFAKVNVDEVRDVAQKLGISAMPTFKVFKNKVEVETQQGWPGEAKIKQMMLSHGAVVAKAD